MSDPEPEEVRFACIGCGELNPSGAEVCSGCDHRFGGPDIVSTSAQAGPPSPDRLLSPEHLYESPKAQVSLSSQFRLGTAMVFIALVAVCLRLFVANMTLGVIASLLFLPASIRTFIVSAERATEGRPMAIGDKLATFWRTTLGLTLIVVSSGTSFIYGWTFANSLGINLVVGSVVGAVAATGVAFLLSRDLLKRGRRSGRERNRFRWY